jgi:hypothetical protein
MDSPGTLGIPDYRLSHGRERAKWGRNFKVWLSKTVEHLKARGIGYDRFALYLVDEPGDDPTRGDMPLLDVAVYIKRLDPNVLLYVNYCPETEQTIPIVGAAYDILCPAISRVMNHGRAEAYRKTGKRVWGYVTSSGKRMSPVGYYRRLIWTTWQAGFTGCGFWSYSCTGWGNVSTPGRSAWDDMDNPRGNDAAVVYESPTGPVSSRRWETWREGIEDYEYLWLLRDKLNRTEKQNRSDAVITQARLALAEAPAAFLAAVKGSHANQPSDKKVSTALSVARGRILQALMVLRE